MKINFEIHGIIQARRKFGRYKIDRRWYIIVGNNSILYRMTKYKQILRKL